MFSKPTFHNQGFSVLGVIVAILIISAGIMALFKIVANSNSLMISQLKKNQAFYSAHAGIEYALRKIRVESSATPSHNRTFADTQINISYTPSCAGAGSILSSASWGSATASLSLANNISMAVSCLVDSTPTAFTWTNGGKRLNGLRIRRPPPQCNGQNFYITGAKISWSPVGTATLKKIEIHNGNSEFDDAVGLVSGSYFDFGANDFHINNSGWRDVDLEFSANMSFAPLSLTIEWYLDGLAQCQQTVISSTNFGGNQGGGNNNDDDDGDDDGGNQGGGNNNNDDDDDDDGGNQGGGNNNNNDDDD